MLISRSSIPRRGLRLVPGAARHATRVQPARLQASREGAALTSRARTCAASLRKAALSRSAKYVAASMSSRQLILYPRMVATATRRAQLPAGPAAPRHAAGRRLPSASPFLSASSAHTSPLRRCGAGCGGLRRREVGGGVGGGGAMRMSAAASACARARGAGFVFGSGAGPEVGGRTAQLLAILSSCTSVDNSDSV